MLTYRRLDQLEIVRYTNFDFVKCQDSIKSTSGYIYLLVGAAISWKSAKQSLIISSMITVEFVACFEASNHII